MAILFWPEAGRGAAASSGAAPVRTAAAVQSSGAPVGLPGLPAGAGQEERARLLAEQYRNADQAYCSYHASTKYPVSSRPIAEHPDQVYPNQPVVEIQPMRGEGGRGADPNVLVQTSQSRVFMVAGEAVAFSLRAVNAQGGALPLVVTRAVAGGMTFGASRPAAQVSLPFADDGAGADPVGGDSHFAALLAPAQTSLAQFNGTIRTEVRYTVNGRAGVALFDVNYSPEVPATWAGQAREVIEDGSLSYVLKADVRQAGRYIVTGRVDDAKGKPFALATFNDVLRAGPNDIRLTVFGKLLHDKAPAMPLTLRDVDGYLLKENVDPDRALMPRLAGRVVAGKPHPLRSFSDTEYAGEERTRHLAEFANDASRAKDALAAFDPARPLPASQCDASAVK
nr:hypothetical protein [Massilia polaris]